MRYILYTDVTHDLYLYHGTDVSPLDSDVGPILIIDKLSAFYQENDPAMQRQMESFIGKVLHQSEEWFHCNISRDEAERRLQRCGCNNGMFLIRERKSPPGTFAMGLCHNGAVVHYLVDSDSSGQLSIQSGPKFENLMLLVDHYSMHNDGLLHNLKYPCDVSLFEGKRNTLPHTEFPFAGRPVARSFGESDQSRSPTSKLNILYLFISFIHSFI